MARIIRVGLNVFADDQISNCRMHLAHTVLPINPKPSKKLHEPWSRIPKPTFPSRLQHLDYNRGFPNQPFLSLPKTQYTGSHGNFFLHLGKARMTYEQAM